MTIHQERFWLKVDKAGPVPEHNPSLGPCWLWTAAADSNGYGTFKVGVKMVGAHRVAYELLVGPIPDGFHIDHLCRVRACVNPAHLEPVTSRENTLRGVGFSAVNARKTHCPQGHQFTPENTYTQSDGRRRCRKCRQATNRASSRRYRESRRSDRG